MAAKITQDHLKTASFVTVSFITLSPSKNVIKMLKKVISIVNIAIIKSLLVIIINIIIKSLLKFKNGPFWNDQYNSNHLQRNFHHKLLFAFKFNVIMTSFVRIYQANLEGQSQADCCVWSCARGLWWIYLQLASYSVSHIPPLCLY